MGAWICGAVALAAIVLFAVVMERARRAEQYFQDHAEEMVGWIVQANPTLYRKGGGSNPAQVFVCFDRPTDALDPAVHGMAVRAARLKTVEPSDDVEAEVASLVRDEMYRPHARYLLPEPFSGPREVYSIHVFIRQELLPGGVLSLPFIRCRVLVDRNDMVVMTKYRTSDLDLLPDGGVAPWWS